MAKQREQLSVPVSPELRQAVEQAAQAEDRTVANWVRRVVAEAAHKSGAQEQGAAAA
jgi:uncharacterized protein (DUF1778 family)